MKKHKVNKEITHGFELVLDVVKGLQNQIDELKTELKNIKHENEKH